MVDPVIINPAVETPATPATPAAPAPAAPKTFTQEEVDTFVTKRLVRERASIYKTLGIDDEAKIPELIGKVKEYDTIKPEYETMKGEREKAKYADVLKTAGIDDAFLEFALSKVDKGKDIDAYKVNATEFAKANPKMLREKFQTTDASPSLGGGSKVPDFTKMSDAEIVEWTRKYNWDGTEKRK